MLFKIIYRYISYRKIRTILTILGVLISVTFLITVLTIGQGTKIAVEKFIESMGHDKIFITTYGEKLTDKDFKELLKIRGIKYASRILILRDEVSFKGEKKYLTIYGIDPENAKRVFGDVRGYRILYGRWLLGGERFSAVIGYEVSNKIFSRKINVGDSIYINGWKFKVVGIFQKTGIKTRDSIIYVNINTLRDIKNFGDIITSIVVKIKENEDPERIRIAIKNSLSKYHSKENVIVLTPRKLRGEISRFFTTIQSFLASIVLLSIIVSTVGIMNTMHMNIIDRRRDIGIMKALGCSNIRLVSLIFLESFLYTNIGYFIGLFLGYLGGKFLEKIIEERIGFAMFKAGLSIDIIINSYLLILLLAIISSIYPAYKISKLDPIKVIREGY